MKEVSRLTKVMTRVSTANIIVYFLNVLLSPGMSSPSIAAKSLPSFWDSTVTSISEGFFSAVFSSIFKDPEDEEDVEAGGLSSPTTSMSRVLSQSKLAGRQSDSPMDRMPPEAMAAAFPAKDTHSSDRVTTLIAPMWTLAVTSHTMTAIAMPPTDPATAPALLRSFHLDRGSGNNHLIPENSTYMKVNAMGKTPDAVATPRK